MYHLLLVCLLATASSPADGNVLPKEIVAALSTPDAVTLYSIEPLQEPQPGEQSFRGYRVLGHMRLNPQQERQVAGAVKKAVVGYVGYMPNCFDPRAAIRVVSGHRTYDLLICYQCNHLMIYKDDTLLSELGISGSPRVLNSLLSGAQISLSTSAH
jgi:hypothetical protein